MKKYILFHIIFGLSYVFGAIWGIFEGLDYLINRDPANWSFLWFLIGGIVGAVINIVILVKKS